MANKLLLPGFGGQYVTEAFTATAISANSRGTDILDLSHCGQFAVQVISSGTGSINIEQSFDGTHWATLSSSLSVLTSGTTLDFDITDGPFGLIRFNQSGITAGTSITFTVTGFPVQIRA